jgi:phosphoribosylamine---glycine ligase
VRATASIDSVGGMGCYAAHRDDGIQDSRDSMKVLVVGSGGREHALCWAIAASPLCDEVLCAPGNGGIAEVARCVAVDVMDFDALVALCRDEAIEFVVVGPEAPLVGGLVERLEAEGIEAFGPTAAAAQLEGSKAFTKDLCEANGIPAAASRSFSDAGEAAAYVESHGAPVVIKADGLAAGKGVTVAQTLDEALAAVAAIGAFGDAASTILVEDVLLGEEASFFALVDGESALPLAGAQDHKAVGDGDVGPNTGGMGAYSPAPILDGAMVARVMDEIVMPTVRAMAAAGSPYKGVLYAGLMIDDAGPKLLEYNVRFGDPECQVLLARLRSDLLPALMASRDGELANFDLRWRDEAALCVVLAAEGYPGSYEKGSEIRGLDGLDDDDLVVFHAGTARRDGRLLATGGRVLGVTARAASVAEAQARAYGAVARIDWPQGFCRSDIGKRAVDRGV